MKHQRNIFAGAAVVLACGLPGGLFAADPVVPAHVTGAINHMARAMVEVTRDKEMKPADVLTFSEVKSGGVAVDLVPDEYWTHLLSKAVGPQGHVYPVYPIRGYRTIGAERAAAVAAAKAAGKRAPVHPFDLIMPVQFASDYKNVKAIAESIDWFDGNFGIPMQADVVFTANAYHDFHNKVPGDNPVFMNPMNMEKINKAIYRAMNPGGVYVISDYASAPGAGLGEPSNAGAPGAVVASLHRIDPEWVKADLKAAGFEYAGSSNVYANPADDHTKPAGPNSDRFVLKFRKPRTAPPTDKRPTGEALATWKRNWFENTFIVGGDANTFTTGMYYHADGTVQETGGNPNSTVLYGTWYWDADGHNCQYHESANSQGFVVCHPMPEVAMKAKPGDTWITIGGGAEDNTLPTMRGLAKGMVYAKPRAGRGGAGAQVAPAGQGRTAP